jgi:GntR family transcriptional repressor for pyruvate dehydrogenase complex
MRKHRDAMMELAGDIVAGRLAPGAVLPREVALAERYEISRGVARECLRALEERGLVTVKHGSVTTVNPRDSWDLFDVDVLTAALASPEADRLLGEYLECRRIIEVEAAGLAAERATRERIGALEDRFEAMVAAVAIRPAREQERAYHAADVAFHIALVEATGNAPLASLVKRIDDALLAARYPLARPAYRRTRAIPEHEAILVAVRARDGAGARAAMREHLDTIEGYLREHARKVARAA